MKVKILFFAELREIFGKREQWFDVREGLSVNEFVEGLVSESPDAVSKRSSLIFAVNENFADGRETLKDQDVLALMTPMAGG